MERSTIEQAKGGRQISERLHVPFLGELPLDATMRRVDDEGNPIVKHDPASPSSPAFFAIADRLLSL